MATPRGGADFQMSSFPQKPGDSAALLGSSTAADAAPILTLSNVILGVFTSLSVVSVLAIIVLMATRENGPLTPDTALVPCAFRSAFTNWNTFGFNASEVVCPVKGYGLVCEHDNDCTSIDIQCFPGGGTFYLSCLAVNASVTKYCGYNSFAMPGLMTPGGTCNASDAYSTCAFCNGSSCAGQAVCVRPADCSKQYLTCYSAGNSVPT